jgi:predicted enzyme related to lactoylglutathione lyase
MPGLRTLIFDVADLPGARRFYTDVFGKPPYFDEPFYVGFEIGGYELGLRPAEGAHQPGLGGATGYFDADDVDATIARVVALGAKVHEAPQDVGDGIRTAVVVDPFGNKLGFIRNPHFALRP